MLISPAQRRLWISAITLATGISFCLWALPLPAGSLIGVAISTLGLESLLALVAISIAMRSPKPVGARLGLGPSRLSLRGTSVAILGTLALSHALDGVLSFTGLHESSILAHLNDLLSRAGPISIIVAMVGMGIAPAIGEEVLCRGLLQRGLAPRLGGVAAVTGSALIFGALHLEWIQGSAAFVLGLYLGTLAHVANSIRPAILCHAVNNVVAIGVSWMGAETDPSPQVTIPIALFISAIAMVIVLRSTEIRRRVAHCSAIHEPERPEDSPNFGP
ncbi:CPBP family intramembrane metalloprotease [Myxococcota bacterium]|nr:CPBP family intramembrane metalloprotease [Myxococcota bacterium]